MLENIMQYYNVSLYYKPQIGTFSSEIEKKVGLMPSRRSTEVSLKRYVHWTLQVSSPVNWFLCIIVGCKISKSFWATYFSWNVLSSSAMSPDLLEFKNCNPNKHSSELWSSQLWTQFKQLRIEAWKSQDFNGVWTRDLAIPVRRSN